MTNNEIISNARFSLMEQGLLNGSGVFAEVVAEDGSRRTVELPEEIHTFQGWKARGFKVNRGEHSKIKLSIWKHTTRRVADEDGNEEDQDRMFMTDAYFFTPSQVAPIEPRV